MSIPAYLPYFVFAGTAATVLTILYGLNRALADAAWPMAQRARAVLAAMGVYHVEGDALPTIQFGIVPPILIGMFLIWRSDAVARLIDAVPQEWLVAVQLYRALGVIFLILFASGKLPGPFAWPAGVGDMAVGLLAPVVGFAYARAPRDAAGRSGPGTYSASWISWSRLPPAS